MKIESATKTIREILAKKYRCNTDYQRNEAWSAKTQKNLIDSIINGYYIPPILIANDDVIDGKQRLISITKFIDDKLAIDIAETKKKFSELDEQIKEAIKSRELIIHEIKEITEENIRETFMRINEGSIKLTKIELILAKCTLENRNFLLEIAKNGYVKKISNDKKNDKRFSIENLILRIYTILSTNDINSKASVRNKMEKIVDKTFENIEQLKKNFENTLEVMYDIFSNDTIPQKSFNTIFKSIFCALYPNIESFKSFRENKKAIKEEINEIISEISKDQMGGGIKFDSYQYIKKRINKITEILNNYVVDKRRAFSSDQKLELWNSLSLEERKCSICKEQINNINDAEVDHITPYIRGGKTELTNAQLLHMKCNRIKGEKKW